jgi:hypothetical protein
MATPAASRLSLAGHDVDEEIMMECIACCESLSLAGGQC